MADDEDEMESFIATNYKPRFDREHREAYGIAKKQEVGTFVLVRNEWTPDWELFATRALSGALKDEGLSDVSLLRWQSRGDFFAVRHDCVVEAEGTAAEQEWERKILADETFLASRLLMWSSTDGANRALAEMAYSDTDGRGYPPGTDWGVEDYGDFGLRVVVFFVWGDRSGDILAELDRTTRMARDNYVTLP